MFKFALLFLGLAAYGAYALVERVAGTSPVAAVEAASRASIGFGSMAVDAVANLSGLQTAALPDTGCAANALSQDNLAELLANVPAEQQEALSRAVDLGTSAMAALQLYSGDLGVGLCLPGQNKVVLLPAKVSETLAALRPPGI